MSRLSLSWIKPSLYPWAGMLLTRPGHPRPYFGPPSRGWGGPGLKRIKLINRFGNFWLAPNLLYVTSGLPMSLPFLRWAKKRGARILLNQDGVYSPSWAGATYRQGNNDLTAIHALADYVFYQSHFCHDAARRYLRLPPGQSSEVLYNAVDLEFFTPRVQPAADAPITLLCAGYFYASKHYILHALLDGLREALQTIPDVKLLVAGKIEAASTESPANAAWLQKAASDHGLPPHLVMHRDSYPWREAPAVFHSADLFIHLKNNDPCPSIVLEAMACGLPVIHTSTGGTPELVADAGIKIDHPADMDQPDRAPSGAQIGLAIREAIRQRVALSNKARAQAAHFSMAQWYKRHADVMSRLTGDSGHG